MKKKIGLGQTISILANVGVIAGIVFLAFELRQNNAALTLQARLERENTLRRGIRSRIENPDLIGATATLLREEPLSMEQEMLLRDHNRAALVDWWLAYRQVEDGALPPESLPLSMWRYEFHRNLPRMHEAWAEFKLMVPQETDYFRWFEENVVAITQ